MPGLRELQSGISASILGRGNASHTHGWVRGNGLAAERRIQVYRNNVLTTLTEALRAVYPVINKLVGDGFFRYAAHEFIHKHPSHHGNLHQFGDVFAEFLDTFAAASAHRYLPDVARLEWAYHEVYHAADHAPLNVVRLQSLDPDRYEGLRFQIHPARRMLHSLYPVVRIWEVNQPHYDGDQRVDLDQSGAPVLILRTSLSIEFRHLAPGEYAFLSSIAEGKTLGDSTSAAIAAEPTFDLEQTLSEHVRAHTLVDFSLE